MKISIHNFIASNAVTILKEQSSFYILKMNFINADSLFKQFRAFLQLNLTFNILYDSQNSNIIQTEVYAGYNLQINIINSVIYFYPIF